MDAADAAILPNAANVPEMDGTAAEEEKIRTDAAENTDGVKTTDAAESADGMTMTDAAESADGMTMTDETENAARAADVESNLPARFRRLLQDRRGRHLMTADVTEYFENAGDTGGVPGKPEFLLSITFL